MSARRLSQWPRELKFFFRKKAAPRKAATMKGEAKKATLAAVGQPAQSSTVASKNQPAAAAPIQTTLF